MTLDCVVEVASDDNVMVLFSECINELDKIVDEGCSWVGVMSILSVER